MVAAEVDHHELEFRALVTPAVLEARLGVQMLLAGARAGVKTGTP
jgi:hypothetical protein